MKSLLPNWPELDGTIVISARDASLLSAIVAASVVLIGAIVALVVNDLLGEVGAGAAVVGLLATGLLTYGLVAVFVRFGLRISCSNETRVWIAIAVPLVSMVTLWFLPAIPLEKLGDEAFEMFAVSHPTVLARTILLLAALFEAACVLVAVSFAFGHLSRRLPATVASISRRHSDRSSNRRKLLGL